MFFLVICDKIVNFAALIKKQIVMRKVFVACMAALVLAACAGKNGQKAGDNNGAAAAENQDTASQAGDSLAMCQWVESVYADVFGAYVKHRQGQAAELDAAMFDRKYFSAGFLSVDSLIRMADDQEPGMVGFRDADHWIQGQDWCEDLACRIDSTDKASTVYITITNCQNEQPVALLLEKTADQQWRIADMSAKFEKDWVSELVLMKAFLREKGAKK